VARASTKEASAQGLTCACKHSGSCRHHQRANASAHSLRCYGQFAPRLLSVSVRAPPSGPRRKRTERVLNLGFTARQRAWHSADVRNRGKRKGARQRGRAATGRATAAGRAA
jgi:hypothetical protein